MASASRVKTAPLGWERAGFGYVRRLARLCGGDGEAVSSSSRVNMKLMSACQLSK